MSQTKYSLFSCFFLAANNINGRRKEGQIESGAGDTSVWVGWRPNWLVNCESDANLRSCKIIHCLSGGREKQTNIGGDF